MSERSSETSLYRVIRDLHAELVGIPLTRSDLDQYLVAFDINHDLALAVDDLFMHAPPGGCF